MVSGGKYSNYKYHRSIGERIEGTKAKSGDDVSGLPLKRGG